MAHPLESGQPPAWASCWGDSRYGPWAGFMVEHVVYRMMWCPPGTFQMGSPESEAGRSDDEAPHRVTLTAGFWMAELPCTQALWTAVMGNNPSRFLDPERPVEQVSWEDVQVFLQRINEQNRGLDLRLPTEAEWEYACRAGTTTATYAGNLDILGDNSAPILDPIAWYGGNSGVEYDLEEAEDSSGWSQKQYPHEQAGSRAVKTRAPNPWGLYDMLGNVWEWCADGYGPYGSEPLVDPTGATEGSERVVRGGGWVSHAQDVRAAVRYAFLPSSRSDDLGFRFSRGQAAPGRPE